jgi:hypothetical protein
MAINTLILLVKCCTNFPTQNIKPERKEKVVGTTMVLPAGRIFGRITQQGPISKCLVVEIFSWMKAKLNKKRAEKGLNFVKTFKGTKDWDFFWLRFWNLYYFFVSYVKILRFYKKKFFDWAIIGGGTIFFSFVNPLLVFPKFDPITAPGMALRVNLGPKCQNLFPLVWD